MTYWPGNVETSQCDQQNIAKLSMKVAQNDFTSKMKDFDHFTKIA